MNQKYKLYLFLLSIIFLLFFINFIFQPNTIKEIDINTNENNLSENIILIENSFEPSLKGFEKNKGQQETFYLDSVPEIIITEKDQAYSLTAISISSNNDNNSLARQGDDINLLFSSSGDLNISDINVFFYSGGDEVNDAVTIDEIGEDTNNYYATYEVNINDSEGLITFTISASNLGADYNATTDDSNVTIQFYYFLNYYAGENGSLEGDTNQIVYSPDFNGTDVNAVPDTNYHFVKWDDDSTENPRTDINVIDDINVTAEFAYTEYLTQISIYSSNDNNSLARKEDDINLFFTATAALSVDLDILFFIDEEEVTGEVTINELNKDENSYYALYEIKNTDHPYGQVTFIISASNLDVDYNATTDDSNITVKFLYTLRYIEGDNGSITGTKTQYVEYGEDGTSVTAVPNTGYVFDEWSDEYKTRTRKDTNVIKNILVEALFISATVVPPETTPNPVVTTQTFFYELEALNSSEILEFLQETNLSEEEIEEYLLKDVSSYLEIIRELRVRKTVPNTGPITYVSTITIIIENISDENLSNLKLIEIVPKEIAEDVSEIEEISSFEVILEDPMFEFSEDILYSNGAIEFSYSLDKQITEEKFENMSGVIVKAELSDSSAQITSGEIESDSNSDAENLLEQEDEEKKTKEQINIWFLISMLTIALIIIMMIYIIISSKRRTGNPFFSKGRSTPKKPKPSKPVLKKPKPNKPKLKK